MPFRRRIPPMQTEKHVIDTEGALSGAVSATVPIATTVVNKTAGAVYTPVEVSIGEQINGIFLSIFILGATGGGQDGSINWYIAKARATQNSVSDFPEPGETGPSGIRSQIFHEEKGLAGSADGTPMAFKGVIVIPKGMRRMRQSDQFFIKLRSTDAVADVNFCVKAIYKSLS